MKKLVAVLFVGVLALGVMGCPPPGAGPKVKVQGCKKCGKAPCECKGEKVQGCKKCGKAPCVCKKTK